MKSKNGGSLGDKKRPTKVKLVLRDSAFVIERDKKKSLFEQGIQFCKKVRGRLNSSSDYQMGFLKHIHDYSTGKIGKTDLRRKISRSLSKYPDLVTGLDDFVNHCQDISFADHKLENVKSGRSQTQELDLSKCVRSTPSYWLLPEDYEVAVASQKSEIGGHVLNDSWVCSPVGNRNYSPKIRGRNKYEQALDRCEGDQYEFDMLLNSMRSAAKCVKDLMDSIKEKRVDLEGHFRIEDHLSVLNLRCIERLYGEKGHQMLELLREKPNLVLNVILSRLKQKIEEMTVCRSGLNKVWAQVHAENHHKSLRDDNIRHKERFVRTCEVEVGEGYSTH